MIKIACDRCGRDIAGTPGYIAWKFKQSTDGDLTDPNIFEKCDYCKECMSDIREFITHSPARRRRRRDTGAPAEQPASETSPPAAGQAVDNRTGKRNRRIDMGKVNALRKAGWSIGKIAEEMSVPSEEIAQMVYDTKKQERKSTET